MKKFLVLLCLLSATAFAGSTWYPGGGGSGGSVTSVTGTAPVVSSGGTTPAISMAAATAAANGYLASSDWATFNGKGTGTVTTVTGTAPVVSSGGTTPAISMAKANTTTNGYLGSTDWATFNSKAASGANADITSLSQVAKIYPAADGTAAVQFEKADGTTAIMTIDSTNKRVGIGSVTPTVALNVVGAANLASILAKSTTNDTADQLGIMAQGANANDSAIGLYNTTGGGAHWTFRANPNTNFEFVDSTAGQLDMVIHQTTGIVSIGVGYTGTGAALDVAGGVRLNTASAKPACASGNRGTIWVQQVGAGTTDTMFVCLKAAADTYSWVQIVTGG